MSASIQTIFDNAFTRGVRPDAVRGASEEAIEQLRASQDVPTIPQAVRAVWLFVGDAPGPWWAGELATVGHLDGELKEIAIEVHDDTGGGLRDAPGMLVLLEHQGYEFHVIDGADLELDDPPVWLLMDGEPVRKMWSSVTEWFTTATKGVLAMKERIRHMKEEGGSSTRSRYFVFGE